MINTCKKFNALYEMVFFEEATNQYRAKIMRVDGFNYVAIAKYAPRIIPSTFLSKKCSMDISTQKQWRTTSKQVYLDPIAFQALLSSGESILKKLTEWDLIRDIHRMFALQYTFTVHGGNTMLSIHYFPFTIFT